MDTILIVDDSSFIVEGLIAFLKKEYRTLAAYGGAECLQILNHETPSVIILDIMMEPMDGWETLARIKENPETRHIPVLMFSAKKISPEEAEEHRISIDDYLTKPVSPKKITEAIEKVLARRDTNRMVVERWLAAGISQEKIDEYLSLVTSLEVDLSLCQNMKIQYDLIHPEDKNQEEFHAVIKAIEDRVLQERDLIEKLAHEMNDTLGDDTGRSMADGPPYPDENTGPGSDISPYQPPPPEEVMDETQIPGRASAVPENPYNADVDDADTLATGLSSLPVQIRGHSEQDTSRTESNPGEFSVSPAPAPAETPDIPAVPPAPGQGEQGSRPSGSESGKDIPIRQAMPEPSSSSGSPVSLPVLPDHNAPVIDERKVVPADPDLPRGPSGTLLQTGAGTDVPMPWRSPRDRKYQGLTPAQGEKKTIVPPASASVPVGFVARVITFVQSLLGRRK